ncbi:MAG: hypothetical protein M5U07_11805 [Xanthobacteraceae bacterium]|nr:hypothetical protein [Xanthobacteraceae bacterium]
MDHQATNSWRKATTAATSGALQRGERRDRQDALRIASAVQGQFDRLIDFSEAGMTLSRDGNDSSLMESAMPTDAGRELSP